jgi:hypothetical protein
MNLDRQSEKLILENLKRTASHLRSRLSEELQELGDISLAQFVATSGYGLEDVYSGNNPGWTVIRRQAGFVDSVDPDEAQLSRSLARMLHIDDPVRIEAYLEWLAHNSPPDVRQMNELGMRLLEMLHFDLTPGSPPAPSSLQASLDRLWSNPNILSELRELLGLSGARASHLAPDADLESEIPLRLHTRYSRNELLAALGESTAERPATWREGVRWIDRYKLDVFLVTLNKAERRFSPSTQYRDYPISPKLFHWESQSTATEASSTGQRYIRHKEHGSRVLLFVREDSIGESLGASPFLFLGTASYVSHQGERPMAIVWQLDHDMPLDFFQAARVAA